VAPMRAKPSARQGLFGHEEGEGDGSRTAEDDRARYDPGGRARGKIEVEGVNDMLEERGDLDIQQLAKASECVGATKLRTYLGRKEEDKAEDDGAARAPVVLGPDDGEQLLDDVPVAAPLLGLRREPVFRSPGCLFRDRAAQIGEAAGPEVRRGGPGRRDPEGRRRRVTSEGSEAGDARDPEPTHCEREHGSEHHPSPKWPICVIFRGWWHVHMSEVNRAKHAARQPVRVRF
jgi:hypothetical protein